MGASTYAAAGVVLLGVGCLLSLLATASRTARPRPQRRDGAVRADGAVPTSASVARLQADVSAWAKRAHAAQTGRRTIA